MQLIKKSVSRIFAQDISQESTQILLNRVNIAIQASDLDSRRIDGTRVYILNMLNRFGGISSSDDFFVFHRNNFNPELSPRSFPNYKILKKYFPCCWTQTRFSLELWKGSFDALWMPMQALPLARRKKMKSTVTVHDLAFKYFPEFFPGKDLRRLNFFTDFSVKNSDKIIAVSQSTKNDILRFYPEIREEKIKVIHHGFDSELFRKAIPEEEKNKILKSHKLQAKNYILYVGAIQPRKNLSQLIEAFEIIKEENPDLKLVLAGDKAWMWEDIINRIAHSKYREDIIVTGTINFNELAILYRNAKIFVFPSLYEGFGIPILEAMASGVPTVCAANSSLIEVGGEASEYYQTTSLNDLCQKIREVLGNESLEKQMIEKGFERIKNFSWDKCAEETLEFIKS
jgi:glycosyltransferase involved in cell wall biosynthesis